MKQPAEADAKRGASARDSGRQAATWMAPFAAVLMVACVLAVYSSPSLLAGNATLFGKDYAQLHCHRIQYAQEALRGAHGLPGWYTRELLGTPFWSNIHNFPWIPTRLVLLFFDTSHAYAVGVLLAAALSALFTFLYARSIGLGLVAAGATGWTFACAGFFSSRVLAGHLPLLEAYPALPLLLWLIEREFCRPEKEQWSPSRLLLLAVASAGVALAGHPQLPFYALATAAAYLMWRERSVRSLFPLSAMGAGVGCTLLVWWPMIQLIGRSTRVVQLDNTANDVALPFSRLKALVLPWADGWPRAVNRLPWKPLTAYSNDAYFWDTVGYIGLLPLLAALLLLLFAIYKRKSPDRVPLFLLLLGSLSLLTALPFPQALFHPLPGAFLRSSSRQLYMVTLCLSLAFGWAVQRIMTWRGRPGKLWSHILVALVLLLHGVDLCRHDRSFIQVLPMGVGNGLVVPDLERLLEASVGDRRVGVDLDLGLRCSRQYDDAGFFDAVSLVRPYQAMLGLAGRSPLENVESLDASTLPAKVLADLCVKYVVTKRLRDKDLILYADLHYAAVYEVPGAASRASFVPEKVAESGSSAPGVRYERPSSDEVVLGVKASGSGMARLVESWDPGWSATVDGAPAIVLLDQGFLMAVKVPAGEHTVRLLYRTPGIATGLVLSLIGLVLLALLLILRSKAAWG